MTACNEQPPDGHPFYGTMVACHMAAGHEGPHTWQMRPSLARRGVDRLLSVFSYREIASIDAQPERPILARDVESHEVSELTRIAPGPWVLVTFVGGDEYAIWKATGQIYRMIPGIPMIDDDVGPILEPEPPMVDKARALAELKARREKRPEQIDPTSQVAGTDMTYYCKSCGHVTAVLPENWWEEPPPVLDAFCRSLLERGWLDPVTEWVV